MNLLEKKLKQKYPNEDFQVLKYTRMKDPAEVQCKRCGRIYHYTYAENSVAKTKICICRNCQANLVQKDKYQQKINDKYPNEDIKIVEFNGAKGKLVVKCLKCNTFQQFKHGENILVSYKERVCTNCYPNKRNAMQNTINNFKKWIKNNIYFKDFVFPEKINSDTPIQSKCVICGKVNYKTIYSYLKGTSCSCQAGNERLSAEEVKERIGEEYNIIGEYRGLDNNVLIRHNCGFIFQKKIRHGVFCPKCGRKSSKGELFVQNILKKKSIEYIREYTREINGHKLRFDFYLPAFDMFIECQGEQHYKPIEYFGDQSTFQRQREYDELKRQFAENKLLEISYLDSDIENTINSFLIKFNEQIVKDPDLAETI